MSPYVPLALLEASADDLRRIAGPRISMLDAVRRLAAALPVPLTGARARARRRPAR